MSIIFLVGFYLILSVTSLCLHKQTSHPDNYNDQAEYLAVSATAFAAGPFILATSLISTIMEIIIRLIIREEG